MLAAEGGIAKVRADRDKALRALGDVAEILAEGVTAAELDFDVSPPSTVRPTVTDTCCDRAYEIAKPYRGYAGMV